MQDFGSGDTSSNLVGGITIFHRELSIKDVFYTIMPERKMI